MAPDTSIALWHDQFVVEPIKLSSLSGAPPDPALPDPALDPNTAIDLTSLLGELVTSGAALGWLTAPPLHEVDELLNTLAIQAGRGDASVVLGRQGSQLIAFGCWQRYHRSTHRPHADLRYLAVAPEQQGCGTGGRLLDRLIEEARESAIEQLTLDARGDNLAAHSLWRSRGFVEYGRLIDFVAVGDVRYDKTFWVLDLRATEPT